jgi:hypothetical protein
MKGFPGSDQNSDDTSPPKHDLCDFETSLRIHIRHDSDNEREKCTSNENPHFSHFFQFFKSLERTFSSSVDSQNSFKRKKVSNRKGKTYSSCIWHPTKGCFKNVKTKQNKTKQRLQDHRQGRAGAHPAYLRHTPNGRVGVLFVFLLGPGGRASS